MANDEPWAADVERIYQNFDGFTEADQERLDDADFGMDRLHDAFEEGFVDENVSTEDRMAARNAFLSWMGYLGYDPSDFDWQAWHDWKYGKE